MIMITHVSSCNIYIMNIQFVSINTCKHLHVLYIGDTQVNSNMSGQDLFVNVMILTCLVSVIAYSSTFTLIKQ